MENVGKNWKLVLDFFSLKLKSSNTEKAVLFAGSRKRPLLKKSFALELSLSLFLNFFDNSF